MQIAGMEFSVSTLIAGFIFGVFGIFIFRAGKREMNFRRLLLGLVLMTYGLFVQNPWASWGIGLALVVVSFTSWAEQG